MVRAPGRAHGLILAAGQGRRFGGGKLLAPYRGRPLLAYVLDVVETACIRDLLGGGHVVIGATDDGARTLSASAGLVPVMNGAPHLGLSHSLRLGLSALESSEEVGAALVFLADQPLVRLGVVEALVAAWRAGTASVVRPRYEANPEVPGHPALLDRSIWPEVHRLQGDRGFASLLDSIPIPTIVLGVPGANPDVDTQADLQTLEESAR